MPRSATASALSTRGILLTLVVLAAVALVVYLYTVFRPASDATQCLLQQTPKTYKACDDVRHKDDCDLRLGKALRLSLKLFALVALDLAIATVIKVATAIAIAIASGCDCGCGWGCR